MNCLYSASLHVLFTHLHCVQILIADAAVRRVFAHLHTDGPGAVWCLVTCPRTLQQCERCERYIRYAVVSSKQKTCKKRSSKISQY